MRIESSFWEQESGLWVPVEGLPRTLGATSSMDNMQQPLPSAASPRTFEVVL